MDKLSGNGSTPYISAKETNPWLSIDFESEIQIDKAKNTLYFSFI